MFFCQQFTYNGSTPSVDSSNSRRTTFTAAVFPMPGAPVTNKLGPDRPLNNGLMTWANLFCCVSLNGNSFGIHSGESDSSFRNNDSSFFSTSSKSPIQRVERR